jgi:hypothetical protein
MANKICSKCKTGKDTSAFHKKTGSKDGLASQCASCVKEINRAYRQANRVKISERKKAYSAKNRDALTEKTRAWRLANKERYDATVAAWRLANQSKISENGKAYYLKNKEEILAYAKTYSSENSDKRKTYSKAYRELESSKIKLSENRKRRKQEDPAFRLITNRRSRRSAAIRGNRNQTTLQDLGCTIGEWRIYIEQRFYGDMNWDNYGSFWHLDEVIPISAWNLSDPIEQKACFHHFNSQPLFWMDNLAKGGSNIKDYTAEKQELLMVLRALGEI